MHLCQESGNSAQMRPLSTHANHREVSKYEYQLKVISLVVVIVSISELMGKYLNILPLFFFFHLHFSICICFTRTLFKSHLIFDPLDFVHV